MLAPKYDSYLYSGSTVSKTESYEARTLDIESSKASDSEDSNKNYFKKTKTAEKVRYTFQPPLYYTYKIMGSLFGCFTRILMVNTMDTNFLKHGLNKQESFVSLKEKRV